jgi:hypothetical protein
MDGDVTPMLNWLLWGGAIVGLLNLAAIVALIVAYAWHHGVKPWFTLRHARQHAFELLLAQTSLDNILRS